MRRSLKQVDVAPAGGSRPGKRLRQHCGTLVKAVDPAIFAYGGTDVDLAYDATVAEAWLPYLDANAPTKDKNFTGVDAATEGEWVVHVAMQPTNKAAEDKVAQITETTFNHMSIPGDGRSTHISLRFRSVGDTYARLSSAVIHYAGEQLEDK